tara:strand:+ start:297 stop:938 length:642 start_codon:yes stop_codon:yes gene_type:complete
MLKKITLIRHGTTLYNLQDRVQGSIDIKLSKEGYKDIENINLNNTNYDYLYHSSLSRSKDTLYGLIDKYNINPKGIIQNDLIIERSYGIFEGLTKTEINNKYPEKYNEWIKNENIKGENIESIENVIRRFKLFLHEIINSDKNNILAITHSGFLYAMYKFVSKKDLYIKPNDLDINFNNGCVVFLTLDIDKDETKITFDYQNKKLTKIIKNFH